MPATAHRTKRPYQPGIDSFFARVDRDIYLTSTSQPVEELELETRPALPATVRSNLLSVGMRVRKAVPEGYRTKSDDYIARLPESPMCDAGSTISGIEIGIGIGIATIQKPAELQPMCGIHKIGGLSVQPASTQMVLDTPLSQTHSLESTPSRLATSSLPPYQTPPRSRNKNKRPLDLSLDTACVSSDDEEWPDRSKLRSPSVSPRSAYPVSHAQMPDFGLLTSNSVTSVMARPVAKMKKRTRSNGVSAGRRGAVDVSADFEEAEFLEDEDGMEVEMGGM